jgi:hypothetical protein
VGEILIWRPLMKWGRGVSFLAAIENWKSRGKGYLFSGGHWRMTEKDKIRVCHRLWTKRIPAGWRAWTFFFSRRMTRGDRLL